MSLLAPLKKTLKSFGIYLLPLPTEDTWPGAVLDRKGQVIQHLTDLNMYEKTFFDPMNGKISTGAPVAASAVLDSHTHSTSVGAGAGAGLPRMASLEVGVQHASKVTVVIGDLYERKLVVGDEGESLEALDYLLLCNQNQDFMPFRPIFDIMKKRAAGWPTTRWVDLVESTVYAESIRFEFETETAVELEVALSTAVQVDIEAGIGVEHAGSTAVTWKEGLKIPIGYKPVRYAWNNRKKRFVLAWF